MTRTEYLKELEGHLKRLPEEDLREAMDYFTEYFDEAGQEREDEVIYELGSPKESAREIISRLLDEKIESNDRKPKQYINIIWLTILSISIAPTATPLLIALIAIFFALIVVIIALVFSLIVTGIAFFANGCYVIIDSFNYLSISIPSTLLSLGMGLTMIGGSVLAIILGFVLTTNIVKWGAKLIQKLINRRQK